LAAHPVAVAALVYGLLALAAALTAYFVLFTQFAFYDDEGTLLVTIDAFVHGDVLYREIYSPYGPFYYDLFGGLFSLTGWAVTNDASRLIVGVIWVGTSTLFGIAVQRLTQRLSLGAAAMIVAFSALGVVSAETMHPQILCVLLYSAITLALTFGPSRRPQWSGALVGVLLGALVMTKINLGSYAAIAFTVAAILTCEPLYRRRWLRWPAIAGVLALPLLIMYPDLREEWVRDLMALEFLSVLAVMIAASTARPPRGEPGGPLARWLVGALAGWVVAVVAILAFLLLTGPTPSEAFQGIVKEGLKLREVFTVPLAYPAVAVDWGILAVAVAGMVVWLRSASSKQSPWPGLLRILAGVAIWFTLAQSAPLALSPTGNRLALPLVLAWLAALAPAGVAEPAYRRFVRIALTLFAVEQTLQVYPVAGSQIGISSVTFVAVGALCLFDGLGQLRAWSESSGWGAQRFGLGSVVAGVALVAILGFHAILGSAASAITAYDERPALSLPGAHRFHLAPPQGEQFEELVGLLHEHDCTIFIGFPNLDSLYLFSEIEPPEPNAPGTWPIVLSKAQEEMAVERMRSSPRPCAIRNEGLAQAAWLHGTPPDLGAPLVHYIFDQFETVDNVADFEFMLPKGSAGN
jgi:hypothetical protein